MAANGGFDRSAAAQITGRECQVFAVNRACGELTHEIGVRGKRLSNDEKAARVLVQAMDDTRARDGGKPRRVVEKGVLQRPGAVACARMYDEPGRLVDDEKRIVLVHDRKRDRFGGRRCRIGVGRRLNDNLLAAADAMRRGHDPSIERHAPRVDPAAQSAARIPWQRTGERRVEAAAGRLGGERELVGFRVVPRGRCLRVGCGRSR